MTSPLARRLFRNTLLEPDVRGKRMVVYNRRNTLWGWVSKQQGMFSEFFSVIGALSYAEQHEAEGVRVQFESGLYQDPVRGKNWWAYFFDPVMPIGEKQNASQEIHFDRHLRRYGPHGWNLSWSSVVLPRYPQTAPYPMNAGKSIKRIAELTRKYIRIQPEVMEKTTAFRRRYFDNDFVIGIHHRGTDKKRLYPFKSPTYAMYREAVDRVIEQYAPSEYKVFIATDESEFIRWADREFPGRVVYLRESPRLSATDPEGNRGGTHKSGRFSNFLKGETAVMDCLLLSACSYLIKNRSSLSDVSLAFNPALPWTMILGPDDPVVFFDPRIEE